MKDISFTKPLIKWVGGKTQILNKIFAKFPVEINNYYEIFLGGGSVLFGLLDLINNKQIKITGNIYVFDLNETLINMYKNIQSIMVNHDDNINNFGKNVQQVVSGQYIGNLPEPTTKKLVLFDTNVYTTLPNTTIPERIYNTLPEEPYNTLLEETTKTIPEETTKTIPEETYNTLPEKTNTTIPGTTTTTMDPTTTNLNNLQLFSAGVINGVKLPRSTGNLTNLLTSSTSFIPSTNGICMIFFNFITEVVCTKINSNQTSSKYYLKFIIIENYFGGFLQMLMC